MKTLNKVELVGYVSNPEVLGMQNGTQLIKCSLATHESYKNRLGEWEKETTWHRIVFWKSPKIEKVIELKKGMCVNVSGKLVVSEFTDKEGVKRTSVLVQACDIQLVSEKDALDVLIEEVVASGEKSRSKKSVKREM